VPRHGEAHSLLVLEFQRGLYVPLAREARELPDHNTLKSRMLLTMREEGLGGQMYDDCVQLMTFAVEVWIRRCCLHFWAGSIR
jgi:hypothetical protein